MLNLRVKIAVIIIFSMKSVRIIILGLLFIGTLAYPSFAQSKKYFFSIGGEKHFIEEFNYAYAKNNLDQKISKDSINAYLDLYINFRLKVKEAKALGYDTTKAFKEEFGLYKNQLEESFLTPKRGEEALVKEAYERSKWEIRASHILIRVPKEASQKDTLEALKKIKAIRDRILKGEDFASLAKTNSEDPSAKQNGGDLGYFSVLKMVYPFETAAYNTPIGQVSAPVRTQFGYHIIKVVDKRPNEGQLKVAHIMVRATQKNAAEAQEKAKQKINLIDSLLKSGASWNALCKQYSEDQNSIAKNGELKPFGRGQIVPSFEKEAFSLQQINDISKPIQTPYGWHIIKLVDRIPLGSYEEELSKLTRKIKSDGRASMPRKEMLKTLKAENNFYRNDKIKEELLRIPASVASKNQWKFDSSYLANTATLFSVGNIKISSGEFLKNVESKPFDNRLGVRAQMTKLLLNYEDSLVVSFEKEKLPQKYPEYVFLVQEYHDGILLFSIMEDTVWNLSMKDSLQLITYFENNKSRYSNTIKDTTVFSSSSNLTLEKIKEKTAHKIHIGDWENLKSNLLKENNVSPLTLQIVSKEAKAWSRAINAETVKSGQVFKQEDLWYLVVLTNVVVTPPMDEIKGKVIADYQQYLDEKFIAGLKKKYKVKINKKSLNNVYAHFKAF